MLIPALTGRPMASAWNAIEAPSPALVTVVPCCILMLKGSVVCPLATDAISKARKVERTRAFDIGLFLTPCRDKVNCQSVPGVEQVKRLATAAGIQKRESARSHPFHSAGSEIEIEMPKGSARRDLQRVYAATAGAGDQQASSVPG